MFDIEKRKQFETVGELRALLSALPGDTRVTITGDDYCWYHEEDDGSVICLDTEPLDESYDDDSYESEESDYE